MTKVLRKAVTVGLAVTACAAVGWMSRAESAEVAIDAREVELADVLRLLAAQGGPALAADPAVAKEKVTFAFRGAEPQAAARWLCRACGLVIVPGEGGRLTVGRPGLDKAITKEYSVAAVAATSAAAESLVGFIRRAVFASYLNRAKAKNGELEPELDASVEKGRLRVVAPPMVQREVMALLRTMSPAPRAGGFKAVQVAYQPYELGMLNLRVPDRDHAISKGEVSLEVADASAYEAAWALTSASNGSFFSDPWDEELKKTRATLRAEKMSLRVVTADLAKQLRAETVWFDGAHVFVRASRKGLWEDFSVRVYNLAGRGGWGNFAIEEAERRALDTGRSPGHPGQWPPRRPDEQGEGRSGSQLPYATARVGDLALAALPQERQQDVENSQKGGPPGPPPFRK